jgi:hypothetical protein
MMRSLVPDPADKLTALERAVLQRMLWEHALTPLRRTIPFDDVVVTERRHTGVGFFTDLAASEAVTLFTRGTSLRWGNVSARLNADRVDVGFVVFVDDGVVTTIEGHLWGGDEWPERVDEFEVYEMATGGTSMTPADVVDRTLMMVEMRPPMFLGMPADVKAFDIFLCGLLHGVDDDGFAPTSQSARFKRFNAWIAEQRGAKEMGLEAATREIVGDDGEAALRELFHWWNRFRAEGH